MDLGSVQRKLNSDRYMDAVSFLEDVRLVRPLAERPRPCMRAYRA